MTDEYPHTLPWLASPIDKLAVEADGDTNVRITVSDVDATAPWILSRTYDGTTWETVPGGGAVYGPDATVVDLFAPIGRELQYRLWRLNSPGLWASPPLFIPAPVS